MLLVLKLMEVEVVVVVSLLELVVVCCCCSRLETRVPQGKFVGKLCSEGYAAALKQAGGTARASTVKKWCNAVCPPVNLRRAARAFIG